MKVGIIIPCYNEEKRLNVNAFKKWLKDFNDFQLCFVNDGSKDNTMTILNKFKQEYSDRITVINKKKNQGKSMAIKAGARYFYSISTIQYVGYFDADFDSNFDDFDDLIKELKQNKKLEMYFGNRVQMLHKLSKNIASFVNHCINKIFTYHFSYRNI
ncbi:Glycosyl transferase family 2 [Tenacibaculum sp. MAR_2009_124]|uniref:glycosyltransferase n=1 Tax=Tenacibaculum sp. MAR_2009_124 TaxID=1250059 RepID=UPI000897769A|nr:glycosyltransferase [Tenacibaculum sp. MAR_2009_124]SEB50615.1 Glycosyl transferase family 2 [Tenacibaculum sp. MAR_2009_124]